MSTEPKDIIYNNASKNRDHNIFTEEYYGGADTFIYIGKTRYENISALQFQVRETVKPLYGYSSRTFDDLAIGTRIVQGVIKVPVRNTGGSDALTNSKNNGIYKLTSTKTNVPDWVYKYVPNPDDVGTPNSEVKQIDGVRSATIADVQTALYKAGHKNITISGVLDKPTKDAISNYKKEKELTVNSKVDNELTNRLLNYGDKNVVKSRGGYLRYSPYNSSETFYKIQMNATLLIQKEVDNEWLLVQTNNNKKGYVKRSETY